MSSRASVSFPEATNLEYVDREDVFAPTKIFVSCFNSYQASAVVRKLLESRNDDGAGLYEVFGTLTTSEECATISDVKILNPGSESFFETVTSCDYIIYDTSQEMSQLSEAQSFLKHFQSELEQSKVQTKKHFILISTIMTWAQTPDGDEPMTDLNYRKRRPHPCFVNHAVLERDVINLQKKFKDSVASLVLTPGIVYGGRQDIFHFLYKKCFFNNPEVDVFLPATNNLPLIYLEDFANVTMMLLRNFPDPQTPYVLAVQPGQIQAIDLYESFIEAAGGPEIRVRVCKQEEIFLMSEELMTVTESHVTSPPNVHIQFHSNVSSIISR